MVQLQNKYFETEKTKHHLTIQYVMIDVSDKNVTVPNLQVFNFSFSLYITLKIVNIFKLL